MIARVNSAPRKSARKPHRCGICARETVHAEINELGRSSAASKLPSRKAVAFRAIAASAVSASAALQCDHIIHALDHREERGDRSAPRDGEVRAGPPAVDVRDQRQRHDGITQPVRAQQ